MRKIFILSLLSLSAQWIGAQDLLSKIPQNANVVATFNTGKLLQLVTVDEWNNSPLIKKLLEMSSKDSTERLKSISDIGINLSGNTYFFHTENDSIHYNCVLVPIADAAKFDALFKNQPFTKLDNAVRSMADPDSSGFMMWNNQQLLYIKGILKDAYFRNPEVAHRHGLYVPYYSSDTTAVMDSSYLPKPPESSGIDSAVSVTQEEPVIESKPVKTIKSKATKKTPAAKKKTGKSKTGKVLKSKAPKVDPDNELETSVETDSAVETVDTTVYSEQPVTGYFDKDYDIKKRLAAEYTQTTLKDLFVNAPASSIATNPQYMKSYDRDAVAAVWVDRPMDLYYNLIPSNFLYGKGLTNNSFGPANGFWYKNFTARLLFEEKQLRLSSAVELSDEMAAMQQKILNRKLNKKFLDYVNTDSLLGYLTWSMDTKAYLENFPKMLENAYGSMGLGLGSDEYSVLSELISFLLDEEAVGQLIKGDGMVVFNGLYQQQTTYTDYVYDENFKSTAVEKTKTDTLPRFLFMLSSDENNFERKLINYGIKKEVVKQRDGFFEIVIPKSPVSLYFLNKDGIFFLTNSIVDMQNISQGKFAAVISREEKKFLLSHNYTMFINPAKISGEISSTGIGAAESLSSAMNTFSKMGNIRAVMNPVKANVLSGDLIVDVPANNRNSLRYILDLFESFAK